MCLICFMTSAWPWAAFLFRLGGVGPVLTTSMTSDIFLDFSPLIAESAECRNFSGISKVFPGHKVS